VVLDKTGTVTEKAIRRWSALFRFAGWTEEAVLRMAASILRPARRTSAGKAVVQRPQRRGLELAPASGFDAVSGFGVRAQVEGKTVLLGTRAFLERTGVEIGALSSHAHTAALLGQTPIYWLWTGRAPALSLLPIDQARLAGRDCTSACALVSRW